MEMALLFLPINMPNWFSLTRGTKLFFSRTSVVTT